MNASEAAPNRGGQFLREYEKAAPAIYAWARLHIHPPLRRRIDPEDLLQEVSFRAFRRFDTFDPERGNFRQWLFGIAHHVLKEALRGLRSRGESVFGAVTGTGPPGLDGFPAEATNVSTRCARDEGFCLFLDRLDALEDEDRRLVIYRGLERMPHQQVAEVLGIKSDAAEKRWQRLRKKLEAEGLPDGLVG